MTSINQAELEQQLSHINAKIASATDLVQKISVLAIHYTGLLAELQGDIEEIYLRLGDDGNDEDESRDNNAI